MECVEYGGHGMETHPYTASGLEGRAQRLDNYSDGVHDSPGPAGHYARHPYSHGEHRPIRRHHGNGGDSRTIFWASIESEHSQVGYHRNTEHTNACCHLEALYCRANLQAVLRRVSPTGSPWCASWARGLSRFTSSRRTTCATTYSTTRCTRRSTSTCFPISPPTPQA
ncbi:hypothetical protein MTO96_022868 [Rhipicephalus appendiculatus]